MHIIAGNNVPLTLLDSTPPSVFYFVSLSVEFQGYRAPDKMVSNLLNQTLCTFPTNLVSRFRWS